MGHYSDAYDYQYEQERKARKVLLEQQLADLIDFRLWKPDRKRMWQWHGVPDELYMRIIQHLKAELYDLKDVDSESAKVC